MTIQNPWGRLPKDLRIAAVLFCCAACIGMLYVNNWAGTVPVYTELFPPAAMLAYGKGYINPDLRQLPKLQEFVETNPEWAADKLPRIDTFSKADLPEIIPQIPFTAVHDREIYRTYTVAFFWWLFGVAWSSLTPLYGILFGSSIAAAYGLFRLGMNRPVSVLCAIMFMTSPIHLEYLPGLRDYAKAPFILGALFFTGYVLRYALSRPSLWACAAACGALIGLGSGFRTDVLICTVPFLLVILLFLPKSSPVTRWTRLGAVACFLVAFGVSAFPILTKLGDGGNKSHPALMGFMLPFSERLGVGGTPYELGHRYRDDEVFGLINTYARRTDPESEKVLLCEMPEYENVAGQYMSEYMKTFPADIMTRSCAAVIRILDELRAGTTQMMPRNLANQFLIALFKIRYTVEYSLFSHMRYIAVAVLFAIAWRNLYLAIALFGGVLYYAGYSAIQFASRHYFHLEVIPLWFGGVFWYGLLSLAFRKNRQMVWGEIGDAILRDRLYRSRSVQRMMVFAVFCILLIGIPQGVLRTYQTRQVHALFTEYLNTEREPVALKTTLQKDTTVLIQGVEGAGKDTLPWLLGQDGFETEWLMAEFAASDRDIEVNVKYAASGQETDLSWETRLPLSQNHPWRDGEVLRMFFPVYYGSWTLLYTPQWVRYQGIEIDKTDLSALKGIYRLKHPEQYPLIPCATLPPWWETLPRCQRFTR